MPESKPSLCISLLAILALLSLLALLPLAGYWLHKAPSGTHGLITVECYVDESPASLMQIEVIRQLEREYSGQILFCIIPIKEHPELRESYEGSEFGAVKHLPAVRVKSQWFDAHGKVIASGWNMAGATPKRHLVRSIESAAKASQKYWPDIAIQRQVSDPKVKE